MATRPSLNIAVPKRKNKASEYNENFELMMDFIDSSIQESKDYVDGYMPSISSSTKGRFLTNNGSAASWASLGNQPFGNYIEGLIITKSSDDTIGISPGSCYDSTKAVILSLAVATTKQNDSQSASSTYYVYIIGNGTNTDFLITTQSTNPTLPTGYVYYRQIGYYLTDDENSISSIFSFGRNSSSLNVNIAETYSNETSWYRVYSDGWCEQGGFSEGAAHRTVTLMKEYRDENYTVILQNYRDDAFTNACNTVGVITSSSFNINCYDSVRPCYWVSYGYIA